VVGSAESDEGFVADRITSPFRQPPWSKALLYILACAQDRLRAAAIANSDSEIKKAKVTLVFQTLQDSVDGLSCAPDHIGDVALLNPNVFPYPPAILIFA
jgi:hypothetical protein